MGIANVTCTVTGDKIVGCMGRPTVHYVANFHLSVEKLMPCCYTNREKVSF